MARNSLAAAQSEPSRRADAASATTGKTSKRLAARIALLFTPYWRLLVCIAAVIAVASASTVAIPLLTKSLFDQALFPEAGRPNLQLLYRLALVMAVLVGIGAAAGVAYTFLTNLVGHRVLRDVRNGVYTHLLSMSLRFFVANRTGEIQSRLQNDVAAAKRVVVDVVFSSISAFIRMAATLAAMAALSWRLTVVAIATLPFLGYFTHRAGTARRTAVSSAQESVARLSSLSSETLSVSGLLVTKVFGQTSQAAETYCAESERFTQLQIRERMTGSVLVAWIQALASLIPIATYVFAGLAEFHGIASLSPGTIVAFVALQMQLVVPIGPLLQGAVEIESSLALFDRIFHYLDLRPDVVESPRAKFLPCEDVRGHVSLRRVWFCYEDAPPENGRTWALRDVSLEVEPGQLAALVGPTGAGKTTLAYLIPRLYETTRGTVELDGIDVREIRLSSLADAVAMVTQETHLFHATVRENLLFAKPDASDAEIRAATSAAQIHERILELDHGYDTVVGERGYRMSGGEKQRLAIARALLKNARVLILDEATSSLDSASERLVQAALKPLLRGRTTIAVAHRLSTILAADVIFVLEGGRLVEQGSHHELLSRQGLYVSMFEEQYRQPAPSHQTLGD